MSRYLKTVRYASRTTGVNFEKILTWGAIGAGLYITLQILGFLKKGGEAAGAAYDAAVNATSDALTTVFGPADKWSAMGVGYTVKFPNGQSHFVQSNAVSPSTGIFTNSWPDAVSYKGDGMRYRLMRNAKGAYFAVLVT